MSNLLNPASWKDKKSPRIDLEILLNWKDQEIANLVIEYYKVWDSGGKRRGGLQQSLEEMTHLKEIIKNRKFNNFVELGVADAGSLWMYSLLFCTPESEIRGLEYDSTSEPSTNLIVSELCNSRNRNVQVIGTHCNTYASQIKDESIDLLHIDADHDYPKVASYFENYYPKVAKGGIILIHDTASCEGSIKFRKEILEPNHNHELIVGKWLITGDYNKESNIPSPGISLIRKN